MYRNTSFRPLLALLIVVSILSTSCVSTRPATYFNDVKDGIIETKTPVPESKIHANDLLSISVSSLNAEASAPFNAPNSSNLAPGNANTAVGYLVDAQGMIQFPILGSIKAENLSKEQLKDHITKMLIDKQLLTDPIITIRFLNFRVTVLGEVSRPSVINVTNEKISLLEAIGLAGDLTIYARRDNILVIREENGEKTIKRLNLNSNDLLSSPYYYLKSNDVVYAEPNKYRVVNSKGTQWVPVMMSSLSLVVIIVDRLIKN